MFPWGRGGGGGGGGVGPLLRRNKGDPVPQRSSITKVVVGVLFTVLFFFIVVVFNLTIYCIAAGIMTSYDLSPLTSKKLKTMRYLSKSVELIDTDKTKDSIRTRGGNPSSMLNNLHCDIGWKEISSVKSQNPVVACLLPALSMDFVASSLLAVGATPLITEGTCGGKFVHSLTGRPLLQHI